LKTQTEFINDSLTKLNAKVYSFATYNKMLETQISQVAQQVAASSQTPGIFPGQTETNLQARVNAISLGNGGKLEDTVFKDRTIEGESNEYQGEVAMVESEKRSNTPLPLGLTKPYLEAKFKKFMNILKKICIKIPFVEALTRMPLYAKFIMKIFSKKEAKEHNETIALTREGSALIKELPPKLGDPGSFSIPCVIGSEAINKAMCDLGASVGLLPLSLFKRMGICELNPTKATLRLANGTIVSPTGFIEDIPVEVRGIYIPTDFIVLDMGEDDLVPILLGRPFLATTGTHIDVKEGKIVFETIGFGFDIDTQEPFLFSSLHA